MVDRLNILRAFVFIFWPAIEQIHPIQYKSSLRRIRKVNNRNQLIRSGLSKMFIRFTQDFTSNKRCSRIQATKLLDLHTSFFVLLHNFAQNCIRISKIIRRPGTAQEWHRGSVFLCNLSNLNIICRNHNLFKNLRTSGSLNRICKNFFFAEFFNILAWNTFASSTSCDDCQHMQSPLQFPEQVQLTILISNTLAEATSYIFPKQKLYSYPQQTDAQTSIIRISQHDA